MNNTNVNDYTKHSSLNKNAYKEYHIINVILYNKRISDNYKLSLNYTYTIHNKLYYNQNTLIFYKLSTYK